MAVLTAKARKRIPKSSFALSGGRYPIHDAAHARNALARVAQHGTPREQAIVRAAVKRRYPDIGQQSSGRGTNHAAMIKGRFQKKAKARGTSLSAGQLAVIDLAVQSGAITLDLAGKWRHGWIPLDGTALASKRHGRKGGSLSDYHGKKTSMGGSGGQKFSPAGGKHQTVSQMSAIDRMDHQDRLEQAVSNREQLAKAEQALADQRARTVKVYGSEQYAPASSYTTIKALQQKVDERRRSVEIDRQDGYGPPRPAVSVVGKGRSGSSVTSAIQVGKGGRSKSGLAAPKRAAPSAPVNRKESNLTAFEVRKRDTGKGYELVHKPSGKKVGGGYGTAKEAEATRQAVADTHHDLTGNEASLTGNKEAMAHIGGAVQKSNERNAEAKSVAAQAARARKLAPSTAATNPSKPGDLAVFSKTHTSYQVGSGTKSHEEHTPVRVTHVTKEGHVIGGYDAAGTFHTIDNRTTTRVLPQDKINVPAFMQHVKATNRWHAGSEHVKPHYDSLEAVQAAARPHAKGAAPDVLRKRAELNRRAGAHTQPTVSRSRPSPRVDKMSTARDTGGMTGERKSLGHTVRAIMTDSKGRKFYRDIGELHPTQDAAFAAAQRESALHRAARSADIAAGKDVNPPNRYGTKELFTGQRQAGLTQVGTKADTTPKPVIRNAMNVSDSEKLANAKRMFQARGGDYTRASGAQLKTLARLGDPVAAAELRRRESKRASAPTGSGEADKYVRGIRNKDKKAYAAALLRAKRSGKPAPERPPGLSVMGAQAVRLQLANMS